MKVVKELNEIHRGGFGIIHKVEIEDGTLLARKTFCPKDKSGMSSDLLEKFRKRFIREVKVQERLPEDFFMPILYSELDVEEPWFLMPIADKVFDKEILDSKLKRKPPNGLADVLNALEYLHDLGYVHRDLKPGNILLHEEKWKLADMGLITSDSELTDDFITSEGFYAGSLPYMAPEQHTNFHGVTYHADIYSFGAILHDIFGRGKRVPYKRLTAKGQIGVIIEKCTDGDIDRRFPDVSTLRNILLGHLSKGSSLDTIKEDTTKWLDEFSSVDSWDRDKLDSFIIYLEQNEEAQDAVFYDFTSSFIIESKNIDSFLWKRLCLLYLDWIYGKSFDFNYCDALIGHIYNIYEISDDPELKSRCVFTAAELGCYHNRWYVMRFAIRMCSNASEKLANRIAIEIHVGGKRFKDNLKCCVKQVKQTLNSYPSIIREAIEE
jgi:serine/threonine protein kinase